MLLQWNGPGKLPGIGNRLELPRLTRQNLNSKIYKPSTTQIPTPPQTEPKNSPSK